VKLCVSYFMEVLPIFLHRFKQTKIIHQYCIQVFTLYYKITGIIQNYADIEIPPID